MDGELVGVVAAESDGVTTGDVVGVPVDAWQATRTIAPANVAATERLSFISPPPKESQREASLRLILLRSPAARLRYAP